VPFRPIVCQKTHSPEHRLSAMKSAREEGVRHFEEALRLPLKPSWTTYARFSMSRTASVPYTRSSPCSHQMDHDDQIKVAGPRSCLSVEARAGVPDASSSPAWVVAYRWQYETIYLRSCGRLRSVNFDVCGGASIKYARASSGAAKIHRIFFRGGGWASDTI
jgi:hypothetical protein